MATSRFAQAIKRLETEVATHTVAGPTTVADLEVVLTHARPLEAVSGLERVARSAATVEVRARMLMLAMALRIHRSCWEAFDRSAAMLKDVCGDSELDAAVRRECEEMLVLATAYWDAQSGRVVAAARVFRRLARGASPVCKHVALTELGLIALKRGRRRDAVRLLLESLRVEPDFALQVRGYSRELYDALRGDLDRQARGVCESRLALVPGFGGGPQKPRNPPS